MLNLVVPLLVSSLGGGCSSPPGTFVPARTAAGQPLRWVHPPSPFVLIGAENPLYPHSALAAAFARAAARWNRALEGTGVELTLELGPAAEVAFDLDGTNVIVWRLPGFCGGAGEDTALCAAPGALASTRNYFVDEPGTPDDGALLESDIELNGFAWRYGDDGSVEAMDFESMIAHELGHVLGLRHNCLVEDEYFAWGDSHGEPVEPCDDLDLGSPLREATMFPRQAPGEIHARTPLEPELHGAAALHTDHGWW